MSKNLPVYAREEVSKHTTKKDGWFIIHNNVIDVSSFFDDHPGGRDVILQLLGKDATEAFDENNHSKLAHKRMSELIIGHLPEEEQSKVYSLADVKGKNTREISWTVIHNKVYDVTKFLDYHPGGRDILLQNAGADATKPFEDNNHSAQAKKMLSKYLIGDLVENEHVNYELEQQKKALHIDGVDKSGELLPEEFSKSGEGPLFSRLQEQTKLFLLFGAFVLAGILLLS